MKYSISELLALVDDGWLSSMSLEERIDFCKEIAENMAEYQGQISLARRFAPSTSDLDMLDYLDSLLLDVFYCADSVVFPLDCANCGKNGSCICNN